MSYETNTFFVHLFLLGSLTAVKAADEIRIGELYYEIYKSDSGGYAYVAAVVGVVNSNMASCEIPSTVSDGSLACPVVGIGGRAFNNCTELSSVDIPKTVKYISDYAFSGCTSLSSIDDLSGVSDIGRGAFQNCIKLPRISIPNANVGDYAFKNCTSLQFVNLYGKVGVSAFAGCTNLAYVGVADRPVMLPRSREIGDSAFYVCNNLSTVKINEVRYTGSDGMMESWEVRPCAFAECTSLSSAVLEGATTIGSYAFKGCIKLGSVDIPNVRFIGDCVFLGCTDLASVNLSGDVTSIGYGCFKDCTKLQSISIPKFVKKIGQSAFKGCTSLSSVVFPSRVNEISRIGHEEYPAIL